MLIANVYEAKAKLSKLINIALKGEDVYIAKAGKPTVKLTPVTTSNKKRKPGALKGKIWMAKDFDKLPSYLEKAFGMK